ncbi:uncharacterized protein N7515_000683 [Penicillium bovifimosum]|uniref:Nitrogen regulatory protein areA GATA-like domain-containing protein n=1 Tax=Penicillium bovifimosum TaxID=126998 RepID=A0A9W9HGH4_9EURO|nr:uncharacterized protein N7515_000683 [Penicillium bovifimosum]KAJ5146119.1 hypothetical protein N7515_000683 [Penicillium bovifimosum]
MEPKLSHGLVTMTKMACGDELRQETLSIGDYKNLWQAYSTSYLASKDETERRLEHLFWRIWGAQELLYRLNTHTLDRLILRIKAPAPSTETVTVDVRLPPATSTTDDKANVNINSFPIVPHRTTRLLVDTSIGAKITLDPTNSPTPIMSSPSDKFPTTAGYLSPKSPGLTAKSTFMSDNASHQGENAPSGLMAEPTSMPDNASHQDENAPSGLMAEPTSMPDNASRQGGNAPSGLMAEPTFMSDNASHQGENAPSGLMAEPTSMPDNASRQGGNAPSGLMAEPTSMPDDASHQGEKTAPSLMAQPTTIPDNASRQGSKTPPIPMSAPISIPGVSTRQNPKKTPTRNGRGARRRPVFNRRKSSQTTIPKATTASRRRSEPTTQTERFETVNEDSYVELGLLQHLSFRDEDDQVVRDLGRELAPEPKQPGRPSVPLFDEFINEPAVAEDVKDAKKVEPFPRASSLRHKMLSPEQISKVKPSFGVLQSHVDVPGGPRFRTTEVEDDWTDIDAIDATLPITQPFENIVQRETPDGTQTLSTAKQPVRTARRDSLLSSAIQDQKL